MDGLYSYSWLILFAPLLAFAVIIFGTRVWDMRSRPQGERPASPAEAHALEAHGAEGDEHIADVQSSLEGHDAHGHADPLDDDDDPKVAQLTSGARASSYVAIFIMALACLYSWALLLVSVFDSTIALPSNPIFQYDWGVFGGQYQIAFQVDHLSIAMMVVVTTIALLVQIYSQGYMENSAGYSRFYAYLSLFVFSMLMIVFARNFLVIFIGWELVGLSSYLLIGFWINKRAKPDEQRPSPSSAAVQAFVMNRIGDVGFISGIMILFANSGSFDFATIAQHVGTMDKALLTTAMILVFCGAIGKSAQFPLH